MDCKNTSNYLIDFIDKKLDKKTHQEVQGHLNKCSGCAKEYEQTKQVFQSIENVPLKEPSPQLRASFEQILSLEKSSLKSKNLQDKTFILHKYKTVWQVAAAILLLVSGYLAGYNSNTKSVSNEQVATMQNDIAEMKQQMHAIGLLKNESASQRIKAVNFTEEIQKPSKETIEALINTLNTDENSNVRLAAVYSLSRFKTNKLVKEAFINTLNKQNDPMIQIVIINLLVEMEEVKAVDEMKKLLNKKDLHEEVKSQAELGVKVLT